MGKETTLLTELLFGTLWKLRIVRWALTRNGGREYHDSALHPVQRSLLREWRGGEEVVVTVHLGRLFPVHHLASGFTGRVAFFE